MPKIPLQSVRYGAVALLLAAVTLSLSYAQGPPGGGGGPPGGGGRPGAGGPPGGPDAPAEEPEAPPPPIIAFTGNDGRWAWLKQAGESVELYVGGANEPARRLGASAGWHDLALDGEDVWLLDAEGDTSDLVRVAYSGGEPEVVVSSIPAPTGLMAEGGGAYWVETSPGLRPEASFIPAVGPTSRLRYHDGADSPRTLAEWSAGLRPDTVPSGGDIIGATAEGVYVRTLRLMCTEIWLVPLEGGQPTRVVSAGGLQVATLRGGELYWTTPSEEAEPSAGVVSVRRRAPGQEAETVTDWLPGGGKLLTVASKVYYAHYELYRVPSRLGPPRFIRVVPYGGAAADGRRVISLGGADAPSVLDLAGK